MSELPPPNPSSSPDAPQAGARSDASAIDKAFSWMRRHKIWTVVIAFFLLGLIGSAFGDPESPAPAGKSSKVTAAEKAEKEAKAAEAKAAEEKAAKEKAATEAKAEAQARARKKAEARAKAKAKAKAEAKRKARINNAKFPSERELAKIFRDPDSHSGKVLRVWGSVMQFDAATGTDTFLANAANRNTTSYGFFDGENALFTGSAKKFADYVEDDLFTATVEVVGAFSYDTQIGGNTTVPHFKVLKINRE